MTSGRALLQATPTVGLGSRWCGKADRADDAPVPGPFGAVLDDKASSEVLNEMTFGLQLAIGAEVLRTLRRGLTKLETAGYAGRAADAMPSELGRRGAGARQQQTRSSTCRCRMTRPAGGCSVSTCGHVLAGDDLRATWAASPPNVRGKVINALMTVTVLAGS